MDKAKSQAQRYIGYIERSENVQNRQLQSWLSAREYEQIEAELPLSNH